MLPGDIDPRHAYGKLLSHPRVQEYLGERASSYFLPAADVQVLLSDVLEALWRRRNDADPPNNLSRLLALAGVIFEGKLNDYFRRKSVDQRRIVDAARLKPGDPQDHGPRPKDHPNYVDEIAPQRSITPEDALGAKEQLTFVRAQMDEKVLTDDDIEVMEAHRAGERTFEQLAAERGVQADALRQRIHRLRKKLLKAWAEYSLITKTSTIVFLVLLFLVVVTVIVAAVRRREPPQPQPPPVPTELPLEVQPRAPVREAPPPVDPRHDKSP